MERRILLDRGVRARGPTEHVSRALARDARAPTTRSAGTSTSRTAFSPDDRRIIFASDIDVASGFLSPSAFNAQIWTLNAARLDDLQRVTPRDRLHGMFSDYNEFAYYLPGDSNRILVARTFESAAHGLDYWTMNLDGSDAQRLTFTNQPGTEHLGYTQTLGLAFDPHDPRRFVAGLSHDLSSQHIQAVFVTIR
jgi:hypothetical protein